ncbi:hypothetical protein GCM10011495_40600 [Hymenobacter frigidus]|uniref:Uncharacterized protein n=1 Tax=Hymenobacter frigidus TaxID=1524095 RepID=A0ABQ2AM37_9BACT|nr:hypothetical protein GCM10011495_40600 [Hymenobacter frigidus]
MAREAHLVGVVLLAPLLGVLQGRELQGRELLLRGGKGVRVPLGFEQAVHSLPAVACLTQAGC